MQKVLWVTGQYWTDPPSVFALIEVMDGLQAY